MWKQPPKKKCDTKRKEKGEMQAGEHSLSASFWQRITWPGSNTLLLRPARRTPANSSAGAWTKSLSQDNPVNSDLIWANRHLCCHNDERYTRIVSLHVYGCLCAWVSHDLSVIECTEGFAWPHCGGRASLLSWWPESKKQAGTYGLSHNTVSFIKKCRCREAAHSHIESITEQNTRSLTKRQTQTHTVFWHKHRSQYCWRCLIKPKWAFSTKCTLLFHIFLTQRSIRCLLDVIVTLKSHSPDFTGQSQFTDTTQPVKTVA